MQILLVVIFIAFVVLGVPISFALGFVSFAGIAALPIIPNSVVFTKMFNGLNSFTLLAVPLFILAANLMGIAILCVSSNVQDAADRLIECGITGIVDFSHEHFQVPKGVLVKPIDVVSTIQELVFETNNMKK